MTDGLSAPLVLNVDDDEAGRYARMRLLKQAGFSTLDAATGQSALQLVKERRPSVVLLDVHLPDVDGFEVCRIIKREFPDTLVVQISAAFTKEEDRERGLAGGADSFLFAPVDPGVLIATLRSLLRLRETAATLAAEKASVEASRSLERQAAEVLQLRDRALAAIGQGVVITDALQPDQPIIYVNSAFERLTGYSADEVIGRNCRFLQGPRTDPASARRIRAAIQAEQGLVETLLNHRKDGSVFVNHLVISPIRNAEHRLTHFVGVQADVTAQKRSQDDLRASEERYRLLAENSTDMIGRTSIDGRRLYLSPASRELLGYEPEELVGSRILDIAHPDDAAMVGSSLKTLLSSAGGHQTVTYRLRHKDGHWVWLESRRRLVRDEHGRPVEFVSVARDVSERLRLEEQLRQSQKMEAVGQLTGGVAHDFNNLLTVILGNAEILAEKTENPELRGLAEMIQSAADRGSDLTQKLLSFGRRQSLTPKALSLREVLSNVESLLKRALGEHIELAIHAPESPWLALADQAQLESAILNLAVNARDAMPSGGLLRIETDEVAPGPGHDAHSLSITVSDTGTGMPPEVLKRAFEPFFTTKDLGKGSGLGLSMVYGFAQQSGGHVWISSEQGSGTSVTIVLPAVASEHARSSNEVPGPELLPEGKERILVVEDDPQVLQFVTAQLLSLGYDVTAVSIGVDALERLERDGRYHLLFTDVVLPKGLSGVELARRAKQMRPAIKVLLTSGYPEEAFEQHGRPDVSTLVLRKPYRRKELADTLRMLLE